MKQSMNRRQLLAGAGRAGGLLLSGSILAEPAIAQGAGPDVGITANSIKLGLSGGMTGPIASGSRQFAGYMQKQFEKINASGGINGRKIELTILDDGGKGDVALQNALRLLQQQQVFAMSATGTATTAGILDFLTKQNVPFLFPGSYNTELVTPTRANTFALYQPYEGQIAALVKWAYGKLGAGSAVIVRANPPSFDISVKSSAAAVQAGGSQVIATLTTTYNQPEWTSIVIRIKEANPDYIIVMTTTTDMGRLWQELTQQNAQPKKAMLGISPLADQAFLDTAGSNLPDDKIYAAVPATCVQTSPEAQSVRDLMPNEKMGIFGLEGAASAAVIAEAIRRLGDAPTRAKLLALLYDKFEPYKVPYMDTVQSAPNHLMVQSVSVSTIRAGNFVPATNGFVL